MLIPKNFIKKQQQFYSLVQNLAFELNFDVTTAVKVKILFFQISKLQEGYSILLFYI